MEMNHGPDSAERSSSPDDTKIYKPKQHMTKQMESVHLPVRQGPTQERIPNNTCTNVQVMKSFWKRKKYIKYRIRLLKKKETCKAGVLL